MSIFATQNMSLCATVQPSVRILAHVQTVDWRRRSLSGRDARYRRCNTSCNVETWSSAITLPDRTLARHLQAGVGGERLGAAGRLVGAVHHVRPVIHDEPAADLRQNEHLQGPLPKHVLLLLFRHFAHDELAVS